MQAQNRDEQMINASLRFIKENANLTKKEYEKFAKIYIARRKANIRALLPTAI